MTDIEKYITDEDFFVELRDANGNKTEWMQTDFRDGAKSEYNPNKLKVDFAEYDPQQTEMMARRARAKKIRRWLIISFIMGVSAVLSWWSIWH
jgi:ABC-type uncharacterized transport system involved in gliding motility auxiliary subunit